MATWSQTASRAGKYTFNTAGKYVDRDIELTIPQGEVAVFDINNDTEENELYAFADANANLTSVTVGTKNEENKYPITGKGAIGGTITGQGKIASTSIGWIEYTGATTFPTVSVLDGGVTGTANLNTTIDAASVTVTGSGTASKPTIAAMTDSDNISVGTITTTKPTSGYYAAVAGTSAATTASLTKEVTTGYLGDASEASVPSTINIAASTGSTYYLPITSATTGTSNSGTAVKTITPSASTQYANITQGYTPARKWTIGPVTLDIARTITGNGTIGVSAVDPGTSYTANTDAVIPSDSENGPGYLTLTAGYYPATKISLSTLVPDDANIGDTKGVSTILTGTTVYDKAGNLLTGTMPNNGTTGTTLTTQNSTYTIPAGYTSGGTVKATFSKTEAINITGNAATPALNITDSTATITPTAISNNTSYYNITTAVTGQTSYGTDGYIATAGLAAAQDSSATVGRITAGAITNNTSGGTSTGTIALGKQIKIAKGWYPNDTYYTAATADTGTAAVLGASGAATNVNTTTSGSYYVTPSASTTTSGYATKGTTKATGTPVYLATTSLTNTVTASTITKDGTADTTYTAPTLATSKTTGVYLDLCGYGTGTTKNVLTSNGTAAHKYMEVYTGTYTIS